MPGLPRGFPARPRRHGRWLSSALLLASCSTDKIIAPRDSGNLVSVTITAPSTTLSPGQTVRLTAQVIDATGHVLPNEPVTWSSSSPLVATVDPSGLVTAASVGATSIAARARGEQAVQDILVENVDICTCAVVID